MSEVQVPTVRLGSVQVGPPDDPPALGVPTVPTHPTAHGAAKHSIGDRMKAAMHAAFGVQAECAGRNKIPDTETDFEERAAIAEFDGGLSRGAAEQLALVHVACACEPADLAARLIDRAARFAESRRRCGEPSRKSGHGQTQAR